MSTAYTSISSKKSNNLSLESSNNNNLGEFEIKLEISNDSYEIIKINLNEDIFSKINEICNVYEINDSDRQIILQKTFEDIEKNINKTETIIYENENNNDNENVNKFSYNTPKKKDNIITFKKQKNKKNSLNVIKENSPKKRKYNKNIDQNKLGVKMYERGMKKMEIQKMKNENIKKDLTENYSFFPKTNKKKNNKLLASKSVEKLKIEDRLILKGLKSKKNKINKFIEKSYVNDIKNITEENDELLSHTPKLNTYRNQTLLKDYSFDYKKKSHIEEKNKLLFDQIYTFHPKIYQNKNSNQHFSKKDLISRLIKNNKENEEIIIDKKKLSNSLKKKLELKQKERKNEENYYQNLIQKEKDLLQTKKLESTSKNDSNEFNSSIIEKYNKKNKLFKNYTNKVLKETKIVKYKEIFDKLDEDKDGLISYDNLNVKEIEIEDLLKISSLINEIKNKKLTTLSFEDFKILAQQFYI